MESFSSGMNFLRRRFSSQDIPDDAAAAATATAAPSSAAVKQSQPQAQPQQAPSNVHPMQTTSAQNTTAYATPTLSLTSAPSTYSSSSSTAAPSHHHPSVAHHPPTSSFSLAGLANKVSSTIRSVSTH
ncbi:unnamed protein product [Anisakis simplex]|uniref:GPI-anchored protein pfl2 n=1 Tax=Anisakis simplex TaxID=6269 RepID=A0A0M3J0F3_ANISI|nr:unnamed protein product [Anisakis simplex]